MYLSAMLKSKGHEARIFIDVKGSKAFQDVIDYKPDVVGTSCTTGLHHWGIDFSRRIKNANPDIITIMGGPHATFCPEIVRENGIDYAVRGESENAIIAFAEEVDGNREFVTLENIVYCHDDELVINPLGSLIEDLDSIPFPDRSYYDRYPLTRKEGSKNFIAGRGCPYKCTFCCNYRYHNMYHDKGRWVRYRSYDNILDEIEFVRDKYGIKFVGFSDDTLIFNRKWVIPFLEEYKERISLPFISTFRANLADEDLVRTMKEAGIHSVVFGVESGDEGIRNNTLQKGVTDEQIRFAASLFKKYKIKFGTYNMLGLPGETIDDSWKTVKLNSEIRPDFPWCSILQPYPGTKIHDDMEESLGEEISADEITPSYFTASVIDNPDIKQMENLQKLFHLAVRVPFLQPVIRQMIKLPSNIFFTMIFQASYGWQLLRRSNLNLMQMFKYWWTQQGIFRNKAGEEDNIAEKPIEIRTEPR